MSQIKKIIESLKRVKNTFLCIIIFLVCIQTHIIFTYIHKCQPLMMCAAFPGIKGWNLHQKRAKHNYVYNKHSNNNQTMILWGLLMEILIWVSLTEQTAINVFIFSIELKSKPFIIKHVDYLMLIYLYVYKVL